MKIFKKILLTILILLISSPYNFYFEKCNASSYLNKNSVNIQTKVDCCCKNVPAKKIDVCEHHKNNVNDSSSCNCIHLLVTNYNKPVLVTNSFQQHNFKIISYDYQVVINESDRTNITLNNNIPKNLDTPHIFLQISSFLI